MRQVVIEHEQHDDPIITLLKQFNALGQFRALINPYCSRGERYGAKREPLKPTFRKIVKVGKMAFQTKSDFFKVNILAFFEGLRIVNSFEFSAVFFRLLHRYFFRFFDP